MNDPWAEFRAPEANAAALVRNDPTVAPARAPVASSPRVWGDAEAQNAGLYEGPDPWAAFRQKPAAEPSKPGIPQITVRPSEAVAERFIEPERPENAQAMQSGLDQRGMELTRGPAVPPATSMAVAHGNLISGASQGANPNPEAYRGRLVSTDVHEDDGGNILYRDPQTGQVVPTDNTKHVALRDPADNRIKIFERSDATNESAPVGIARVLAPGLSAGAPTARPAIPTPSLRSATPRASEVFSTAKPYYRAFEAEAVKSAPILADEAKVMVDRLQNALDVAHYPSEVAKQVHDTVALLGKKRDSSLQQLQYVKRAVGNLFNSPDPNVRKAAGVASKEINQMISEINMPAAQNLKKADAIQSTAHSMRDLQRKGEIANLRTGRAGYGGNAVNNMRQVLSPIVEAAIKGKTTGFKPDEIKAIREFVEGTPATNMLRQVGAMSPSKGVMQIALGGATGGVTAAVGALANKLATVLSGRQIDVIMDKVARRSPAYAEAVMKAVERFERAQIEFANNPTPNTFGAYVSASRSLSNGLTRDGIQITSGDLLRSVQGPMKSAAEGDEPTVPRRPGE